jgi:hypothetical protein
MLFGKIVVLNMLAEAFISITGSESTMTMFFNQAYPVIETIMACPAYGSIR